MSTILQENYESFQDFCRFHNHFFGHELDLSFEEWIKKPQTLFDLSKEYDVGYINQDNEDQDEPVSKIEILEEMIACILKELKISVDVDAITRCIENTRYAGTLNYEKMDNSPHDISIAASLLKLKEHDFVIHH